MKVILISGHAQNGKDTTGLFMQEYLRSRGKRVRITHYADLLKYILREYFDWDGKKDEHGRWLLQHIGTDVVRRERPRFWIEWLLSLITVFQNEWDYVVIPDARFPDEIEAMRNAFECWHIRVERPGFDSPLTEEQKSHPTETALDNYNADYTICNDGDLDHLKAASTELLRRIIDE